MTFDYVDLGRNLTRTEEGGFQDKGGGHWIFMKLFLGQADEECEVFLNLNPALRMGEFSIKDAEYGDQVIAELNKVM